MKPCGHCRLVVPTRLFKVLYVGIRALCTPCHAALDALGMDLRAAP